MQHRGKIALGSALALGLLAASGVALAQQTPVAPPPAGAPPAPPSWAQGRSAGQDKSPLAPHNAPLTAKKAEEIPVDKIKVPDGFEVSLWASGMPNARSMTLGDKGTLFVGTRLVGRVFAVVERDGKREVKTIAQGLHRPNGVAFKDGALYVAELSRVLRYDDIENRLDNPPEPKVVFTDLPKDEPHGWKFIAFGPDGMLYVPVGAPCNICEPSEAHALIRRIKPDGSGSEVVARGVRNTVGFDWHPQTRELWFTDNGRDNMGDDVPRDELNTAPKAGLHFGFPYCHQGDVSDPEFGTKRPCAEFQAPARQLDAHVAAIGMRFYTGTMFPAEYRNQIIIAEHGSWNRSTPQGYRLSLAKLERNKVVSYTRFAEGWLRGLKPAPAGTAMIGDVWGRPADVLVMPDGALLVSDDRAGVIYRISYKS
jgi:glucose/arabinose dehydrogenase